VLLFAARHTRAPRRGFSLIESLAALAIFGLTVVALIQGIASALGAWRVAEEQTKALMFAENVLQEIVYNGNFTAGEEGAQYEAPDDRFAWSSKIEETEFQGLYAITVSVTWDGKNADSDRSVSLSTLRSERGGSQDQSEARR
jgi:type II secretion system protein I